MTAGPVGVAVIGAGAISEAYLRNLRTFPDVRVLGVADLDEERAHVKARMHRVPLSGDVDAILGVPEVEIVVNLTIPAAHAAVAMAALRAGKHVYGEKPLTLDPGEGEKLLAEAATRGLRLGNAPDTFLGAGLQSARRAIVSGLIGTPVAATAVMQSPGPESWHPNPEWLYQGGAGPLYDMGPYYLTALVAALGPLSKVAASARQARPHRVIGSGPRGGTSFAVEVPTHVMALLDFVGGAAASATFSFDSPAYTASVEIIGTDGTLSLPDPNTFGGPLRVRGNRDGGWRELPVEGTTVGRGIGVLDMARALRAGVPHRASGILALHVLETMASIIGSARHAEFRHLRTTVPAPEPLPAGWDPHEATLG
ncbi:oxidoreductase [Sphaerisporangium krabiense]|uniref:Putative dehydrogenase n=1 Tax=Sphaerisporangium krabiense TaxID=763782 RepID=A0A7W8Z639_9ACTN|nr:Gfo/Idh/MocA family oxidoreductase [Sphaerisporangium krabiense]MBB5628091.1 putative dehydrogenase [Sphaerisporangium krabiense]GII62258.1 oxidoreductase [Sphaerisporangium krabiense]